MAVVATRKKPVYSFPWKIVLITVFGEVCMEKKRAVEDGKEKKEEVESNLKMLMENPYPGRGIVCGQGDCGNIILLYFLTGRSENSQNRILAHDEDPSRVFTEIAVRSKSILDASLLMYNAMEETSCRDGTLYIASNGNQTSSVAKDYASGKSFRDTMLKYSYEPDRPHFTPRITVICSWSGENPGAVMSIVRKSRESDECDRRFYQLDSNSYGFIRGIGYCMTTYCGDGNPLPAFQGNPYPVPLRGAIEKIASTYWDALNPENRVALAVKSIPPRGKSSITILNKHKM